MLLKILSLIQYKTSIDNKFQLASGGSASSSCSEDISDSIKIANICVSLLGSPDCDMTREHKFYLIGRIHLFIQSGVKEGQMLLISC